jgi:hypothetical protein
MVKLLLVNVYKTLPEQYFTPFQGQDFRDYDEFSHMPAIGMKEGDIH